MTSVISFTYTIVMHSRKLVSCSRSSSRRQCLAFICRTIICLNGCGLLVHAHAYSTGWLPKTKNALQSIIDAGAGRRNTAFFDFDNTILCRDIGDATFAVLLKDGLITAESARRMGSPSFSYKGQVIRPEDNVFAYYEHLLLSTSKQNAPSSDMGYAWLTQLHHGLSIQQIVEAAQRAYGDGAASRDLQEPRTTLIDAPPNICPPISAPFFYPEMVDLLAELLAKDYDVRIISASNVWIVRWMVLHQLNPLLQQRCSHRTIPPASVIGISTALIDESNHHQLLTDDHLVHTDQSYAMLDCATRLSSLRTTPILSLPVPAYEGKAAHSRRIAAAAAAAAATSTTAGHPNQAEITHSSPGEPKHRSPSPFKPTSPDDTHTSCAPHPASAPRASDRPKSEQGPGRPAGPLPTPYLAVGDSHNDHAMLRAARHALYIARLDHHPALLADALRLARPSHPATATTTIPGRVAGPVPAHPDSHGYGSDAGVAGTDSPGGEWLLQPALTKRYAGFVADLDAVPAEARVGPVGASMEVLRAAGLAGGGAD